MGFHQWDLTTEKEVWAQNDDMPCYGLGVHADGSIMAVGSMLGHARLWDRRTGRAVTALEGHAGGILACDFGPGPYSHLLTTASSDHSVRVWDLRMRKCIYALPAHNKLVSDVKWHPSGAFLLTTGYDGECRVYSSINFSRVASFSTPGTKAMRATWVGGDKIATAGSDCFWRCWGPE